MITNEDEMRESRLQAIVKLFNEIDGNSELAPHSVRNRVNQIIKHLEALRKIDNSFDYEKMCRDLEITVDEDISREINDFNSKSKSQKYYNPKGLDITYRQIYCAIYEIINANNLKTN